MAFQRISIAQKYGKAAALTLVFIALSSCGNKTTGVIVTRSTQGHFGSPSEKTFPLPSLAAPDQVRKVLIESARIDRVSDYLLRPPSSPTHTSCTNYSLGGGGNHNRNGIFLVANYSCTKHAVASDDQSPLTTQISGKELFSKAATSETASGTVTLYSLRQSKPVKPESRMVKGWTIVTAAPTTSTSEAPYTASIYQKDYFAQNVATSSHWELSSTGNWEDPNNPTTIQAGAKFMMTYHPDASQTTARSSTITLTATSDVTFNTGKCPYPIGTFDWTAEENGKITRGTVTASESSTKGEDITDPDTEKPWPTDCLEYEAQ